MLTSGKKQCQLFTLLLHTPIGELAKQKCGLFFYPPRNIPLSSSKHFQMVFNNQTYKGSEFSKRNIAVKETKHFLQRKKFQKKVLKIASWKFNKNKMAHNAVFAFIIINWGLHTSPDKFRFSLQTAGSRCAWAKRACSAPISSLILLFHARRVFFHLCQEPVRRLILIMPSVYPRAPSKLGLSK